MFKKNCLKKGAIALVSAMMLLTPQSVYAKNEQNIYRQWKMESVQYPDKGQLVPAGPIEIKWEPFEEAKSYEVYLDGVLQNVVINHNDDNYQCEIYSTDVAKHQVQILAVLENGKKISTSIRNFFVSKKGLGFHGDGTYSAIQDAQNMGLSWYYNWGTEPTYTGECPNDNLEFVPMIWSDYEGSNEKITEIKNAGYKTILGYNEPDLQGQADMPVQTAIDNQKFFTESGLRVGSPVTANEVPTSKWFEEYWKGINTEDVDFIPIHNYPGNVGETDDDIKGYAAQFLNLITNAHNQFGKPIWVTEYGALNWDDNWDGYNGETPLNKYQVKKFMEYTINGFGNTKGLNDLDFVERYAWFSFDAYDRHGGDSGLFYTKKDQEKKSATTVGELTDLGTQYREIGNPEGYTLAKLDGTDLMEVADEYVKDNLSVTINGNVQKVEMGDQLAEPEAPTKEGYTFKGWYADKECTKEFDFNQAITDDTQIYAKFLKNCKVVINGNEQILEEGQKVTKPEAPTKEGYIFKGWYEDKECTKEFDFNQAITDDTQIYAKFEEIKDSNMTDDIKGDDKNLNDSKENGQDSSDKELDNSKDNKNSIDNDKKGETDGKDEKENNQNKSLQNVSNSSSNTSDKSSNNETNVKEKNTVKTGDQTSYIFFVLMMISSLIGIILLNNRKEY